MFSGKKIKMIKNSDKRHSENRLFEKTPYIVRSVAILAEVM